MGPDICAVQGNENWDIAKDEDAIRICVRLEPEPLVEKLELIPGLGVRLLDEVIFSDELFRTFVMTVFFRPELPGSAVKLGFESNEVAIRFQPFLMRFLEAHECVVL